MPTFELVRGANIRLHLGAAILILLEILFLLNKLDVAPATEAKRLLAQ